jgi:hypothetical protein
VKPIYWEYYFNDANFQSIILAKPTLESIKIANSSYNSRDKGQGARLPAKGLMRSFTLRLVSRLNTWCRKKIETNFQMYLSTIKLG